MIPSKLPSEMKLIVSCRFYDLIVGTLLKFLKSSKKNGVLEKKTFSLRLDNTNYTASFTASTLFTANEKIKKNSGVSCLFCAKNHKTQRCQIVPHIETRKNIKDS